ncbi:ABC transporter permease [Herbiconiux moechotypicola]|uniref:ABC transporter permease n=1 Tax=Herbiconiux moechotypicola TaxID=637393 RepID=A0ABN3DNN7_9MICO|nr:ABC transporter permease [Herbiconiux moechotypicola]MCS5730410.1 ABC transporter permease [Herbiconiux moechotypicola]
MLVKAAWGVAGGVFVLWAAATLTFFGLRLIPGDPAQAVLGGPGSQASAEALAAVRAEYGLDQPVWVQYLRYLGRLGTGDLGSSYSLRQPVAEIIGAQIGGTLLLAALSLAVAWVIALGLAVWSTRGGRVAAAVGSALEIVAAAVPHFWLAMVLVLVFSTTLRWLPAVSTPGPAGLVLPVLTLALPLAGFLGQVMRESVLDALEAPFVLSARARGESEGGVRWRHVLRHGALPGIALSGWAFGWLISGAVVVETIFARPGLGRTLLNAVQLRDVPLVVGVVLVVALGYVVVTVLTDAVSRIADPRLRSAS